MYPGVRLGRFFFQALKYLVKQNHLFHLCPFCSFHSNFYLSGWVKVVICLCGGLRTGAAHLKLLSFHPIGDIVINSDECRLQQDKGRRGRKSSDMGKKSVQGIHQNQQVKDHPGCAAALQSKSQLFPEPCTTHKKNNLKIFPESET